VTSDFISLLERVVRGGVDFVIVGGFAGVVQGCTYVTQDVDICCDFYCGQFKNLYLDTDIGQLDCVGFVDGVGDYSKVRQASEVVEVENMQLRTLRLDGLIKSKKAMNRPRDRDALIQLEAIKRLRRRD